MSREKNGETDLILLDPSNYRWSSKTKEKLNIIAISNYFIKSFNKFYKVWENDLFFIVRKTMHVLGKKDKELENLIIWLGRISKVS